MQEQTKQRRNIALITHSFHNSLVGETILKRFIAILEPLSNQLYVITGTFHQKMDPRVHIVSIPSDNKKEWVLIRLIKYFLRQIQIARKLIDVSGKTEITIFFIGTGTFVLPVMVSRLLNKRTFIVATESMTEVIRNDTQRIPRVGRVILPPFVRVLEMFVYSTCHHIIIYSDSLIPQLGLARYRHKILISQDHFIDFSKFRIIKPFDEREAYIGYIGRLSNEKGVMNFIRALPGILEAYPEYNVIIGGEGPLRKNIEDFVLERNISNRVSLTGWIDNEDLPLYLNNLRLLVVPSYTETGPIIALEAMGCGTPILGTRVGYILQMIRDGETGFHLLNNNPDHIAGVVKRLLGDRNLGRVGLNAHSIAEKTFKFESIVRNYQSILNT